VKPPAKPLPVVVKPLRDELLSSWLGRTAQFYDVSSGDLLVHFGVMSPRQPVRTIDFALPPSIENRLSWCLRTNQLRIRNRCHLVSITRADTFIALSEPISRCTACNTKGRRDPARRPMFRSWFETWQIACGACRQPFHLSRPHSGPRKANPDVSSLLWLDAKEGSALFARYLAGQPCGILPPGLVLRLLSARVCRHRGVRTGFGLIVPDTTHPGFGAIHASPVRRIRTRNPFKRLALLAALHRFNQRPTVWVSELANAATEGGRTAIIAVLASLPDPIREYLTQRIPSRAPPRSLSYASLDVELHQIRRKLSVNLRQIEVSGPRK
jgi:hypothetical protein